MERRIGDAEPFGRASRGSVPVAAVLFDLGGVLVRLGGIDEMRRLSGITSDEEIVRRWLQCRWVRRFESGRCSPEDFAAGLITDWRLPVDPEAFLEAFVAWPQELLRGAEELLSETAAVCPIAGVSNTNELHSEVHVDRWAMDRLFETAFLSHRIGMVKPDAELFRHVTDTLGVATERAVLLDDSRLNVEGAMAVGMQARQVRSPGEARVALQRLGVLTCRSVRS